MLLQGFSPCKSKKFKIDKDDLLVLDAVALHLLAVQLLANMKNEKLFLQNS